jgi:hypothetical protein
MRKKIAPVYYPPPYMKDQITDSWYRRWIARKGKYIIAQDRERKRPCVKGATAQRYKQLIHTEVLERGHYDPFTGESLRWDLVCQWDDTKAKTQDKAFFETFALLPSVDHIDPYAQEIAFEICSWRINRCKNNLTAQEFVALCRKIVVYRNSKNAAAFTRKQKPFRSPQKYFLPPFLTGIISEKDYLRWLRRKASHLYHSDLNQGTTCAKNGSAKLYKQLIHQAILACGMLDPYTGESLRYDLLGSWDNTLDQNPDQATITMFSLLPTVDHIDPFGTVPAFQICSWLVNRCKSELTPDEFVAQCEKIIAFRPHS